MVDYFPRVKILFYEDLCESKSLVMAFFKNCVRDSDLARDWRSVVGDDDAAPVYVDETTPEAIQNIADRSLTASVFFV